ncbi:MAG: hypothetical protein JXA67_00145 [Micromonosporaceae bacterium]|nr:hypothetical protein [Micromonosporaceae bacterium]
MTASAVVANCAMNRERQLAGVNSYTRELGFDPLQVVTDRLTTADDRCSATPGDGDVLVADLDLASIRLPGGPAVSRRLAARLRAAGFTYDTRRHRISATGPRAVDLPYVYLGADDQAGPNYTGQPAVDSHYDETSPTSPQ